MFCDHSHVIANTNVFRKEILRQRELTLGDSICHTQQMDDPNAERLQLLRDEIAKHKSVAAFARAYKLNAVYIHQLLGEHSPFGEKSARKIGKAICGDPDYFYKRPGLINTEREPEPPPVLDPFLAECIALAASLTDKDKRWLLNEARYRANKVEIEREPDIQQAEPFIDRRKKA